MGEGAAEKVKEIEQTRDRLDGELRALEERLPAAAVWSKRLAGLAVGGGVGGTVFWFAVKRARGRSKKKKAAQQRAAVVQPVIKVLPDRWEKTITGAIESGQWQTWAAVAGGAWLVFRLAELRQLRRMNQALVSARAFPAQVLPA